MSFTKIKLTLKCLGLAFILPIITAIAIAAVGFGYAVDQSGFLSVPTLVTLACMLTFIAIPVLAFALFYSKFYSRIDDVLDLDDGVTVYVISGGLLKNIGPGMVQGVLLSCVQRAHRAFKSVGYAASHVEVKASLNGLFVVFVSDIDEMAYYKKWGIKYKGIAGLRMSNRILVAKQYEEALDATALGHEIFHVIVDAHDGDLRIMGRLDDVEEMLGIEHG